MGLEWSDVSPLTDGSKSLPAVPGIYKLLDGDSLDVLYIGETASLKARGCGGRSKQLGQSARPHVAYSAMPSLTTDCQRLEIECDLIAAYYAHARLPPEFEFGSRRIATEGVV